MLPLTLVTGSGGFVGRALLKAMPDRDVVPVTRKPASVVESPASLAAEIGPDTDWTAMLKGVDVVVHLAARTHVLREHSREPLSIYRHVNVRGTERLAWQAAAARVRRLVFLSSIKVNGESTSGRPFTEASPPAPEDAYGVSKWEAEQALARVSAETGLEIVILRAPLVYGPGVKGNFLRLMQWVARGIPLPLASVNNRRSLVYLDNLVDAITTCVDAPAAAGKTYLVGDDEDVSTPGLIRSIAAALGVAPRLLPCPAGMLKAAGAAFGLQHEIARLTGSLQIDATRIRRDLGWQPRRTLSEGLAVTARWFSARTN